MHMRLFCSWVPSAGNRSARMGCAGEVGTPEDGEYKRGPSEKALEGRPDTRRLPSQLSSFAMKFTTVFTLLSAFLVTSSSAFVARRASGGCTCAGKLRGIYIVL